jgi:hypothetical protein
MNLRYYKNETTMVAKLADQAHAETSVLYAARIKTEHPAGVIFYDMFNQRFAELIVKDCLGIVNRHEYSYHEADPLWETAQLIKEHFGVD